MNRGPISAAKKKGNAVSVPSLPAGACPICGQPQLQRYRPFCSARCMEVDLGRWLKENYRLPTEERPVDQPDDGGQDGPSGRE